MDKQFLEAVFTDAIKHPNFFNGRILTATDLRDEQAANLQRSRALGKAIGSGVAHGLQVTASGNKTALVIQPGLAINPRGDGLPLPNETTVELVLSTPPTAPTSPFVPCNVASEDVLTGNVDTGYYLLAISTVTRLSKTMAPNSGLNGDLSGCTNRHEEIGVQFKLVPIGLDSFKDFPTDIAPSAPDSRSRLAHVFFGTHLLQENDKQPSTHTTTYGLVDSLYEQNRLSECDVPLATFRFQPASTFGPPQLSFVDMWAVRRIAMPGLHPDAFAEFPLSYYVSPRRQQEAAAFFLQFQAQLEEMRTDSAFIPENVVAQEYFEYLPAVGYLPLRFSVFRRGYQIATFFGENIPAQTIEPTALRSLFHASLFEAPIQPGVDDIDIFQVAGAPPKAPYRIFARRTPVILPPLDDEEPPPDTSDKPTKKGSLAVTVLLANGKKVANENIVAIKAVNQVTGQTYTSTGTRQPSFGFGSKADKRRIRATQDRIKRLYQNTYQAQGSSSKKRPRGRKPTASQSSADPFSLAAKSDDAFPYLFLNLPVGRYTLSAQLKSSQYISIPTAETVVANLSKLVDILVRPKEQGPDIGVYVPDDFFIPNGPVLEGGILDPRWPEIYPDWEKEIPLKPIKPDEGWTDPPPEDWVAWREPTTSILIEKILASEDSLAPQVAAADAVLFIRKDYNPAQPGPTVAAFVQTQDGSRFPFVPLAADNALDKVATVDRTGIPDFDDSTSRQLQAANLADLDVFASAPTNLIAQAIGQSNDYAVSLSGETQTTLQDDFRAGYLGYPGINKAQSDALKAQFGSRVDLANASPEALSSALESVSAGFVERFLSDVQLTVPQASFDLGQADIDAAGQEALAGVGIKTNQNLRDRATTEAGRAEIQSALGLSDSALTGLLETVTLNQAKGELISTPEKSLVTLAGVPDSVKTAVATTGIASAKELANTDPAVLATAAGISTTEATAAVEAAKPYGSNAHLTLIGQVTAEMATAAGLTSTGEIARVEADSFSTAEIDPNTVNTAIKLSNQLLADQTIFRRPLR